MTATDDRVAAPLAASERIRLAPLVTGAIGSDGPSAALRRVLVGLDVVAVVGGWAAAVHATAGFHHVFAASAAGQLSVVAVLTALSILALAAQRLYLSRVCSVRTVEIVRIWRA